MQTNSELDLAFQFIQDTGITLFLTGKAGTGKTTFLRRLREQSPKRMVVVAPTGIAAINAGGVTIHSFFQLSFAPFVPGANYGNKQSVYKFGKEKINIIRSLDLLVIDEVSMVRADQLDAIDCVLRRYKDRNKPFGGIQLLLIGDLQQLSPVVKEEEWELLKQHYSSAFFFDSLALKSISYATLELTHVYRQSDPVFINLLNKIRDNQLDDEVLIQLNKRYIPGFTPRQEEGYVMLTTHNYQAQQVNDRRLSSLPGKAFTFQAVIKNSFPEHAFPADQHLTLKKGAQVMFIKNDSSASKLYYNGKIGVVTEIGHEQIKVLCNGDTESFIVHTEEWLNTRYTLHAETKEISEEIEGSFSQYPLRTAWAITIHKSQGLTFEHALIDAKASFAHGQVYVALSRCKTLQGLVLSSPLNPESVICDETISEFNRYVEQNQPDEQLLHEQRKSYYYTLLCEQFDFRPLEHSFARFLRLIDEHLYRLYPKLLERYKHAFGIFCQKLSKVADSFKVKYTALITDLPNYASNPVLTERITSGAHYFHTELTNTLSALLNETRLETDNKVLKKQLTEAFEELKQLTHIKLVTLKVCEEGFSVPRYLSVKAKASIANEPKKEPAQKRRPTGSTNSRRSTATQAKELSTDILNPRLYLLLKSWRDEEANRLNLPVYTVIQQKAMIGISNLLPQSRKELQGIPYFGKKGVEKYGDVLLGIVERYVEDEKMNT